MQSCSVYSLTFQLIAWAITLDEERKKGKLRGPLHGIPILLKASNLYQPLLATKLCMV